MTDITLEQRARELLAANCRTHRYSFTADNLDEGNVPSIPGHVAIAAVVEALRLSAGADSARLDALEALLDEQPNGMLLLHHGAGSGRGITGLGLRNTGRNLRAAIEAAAPRHEPGEGS